MIGDPPLAELPVPSSCTVAPDEQLPDRKDIFHDTDRQEDELEQIEDIKSRMEQFEKQLNDPIQRYEEIPKSADIRDEFVKCGKESCNDCPHGPYFYAYWKDTTTKKLKKKYIGRFDPSR